MSALLKIPEEFRGRVDPIGPASVRVVVDPMHADAWRVGPLAVYLRKIASEGAEVLVVCNGNPIVVLGRKLR